MFLCLFPKAIQLFLWTIENHSYEYSESIDDFNKRRKAGFPQVWFNKLLKNIAIYEQLVGGWALPLCLVVSEFVSWDYSIPNWMESHNPFMFQTTNQS